MRVLFSTLALAMIFAGLCLGQTASPRTTGPSPHSPGPPFAIALDGPSAPVRLNAPISVNITVTNISAKEIWWQWERQHKDAGYRAFSWLLTKGGREVETTLFHRKISGRQRAEDPQEVEHFSSFPVTYPQGKMFTVTVDLNRLYEIKEPGAYTLYVSRLDENSKTTVRSNTLTLNVVP